MQQNINLLNLITQSIDPIPNRPLGIDTTDIYINAPGPNVQYSMVRRHNSHCWSIQTLAAPWGGAPTSRRCRNLKEDKERRSEQNIVFYQVALCRWQNPPVCKHAHTNACTHAHARTHAHVSQVFCPAGIAAWWIHIPQLWWIKYESSVLPLSIWLEIFIPPPIVKTSRRRRRRGSRSRRLWSLIALISSSLPTFPARPRSRKAIINHLWLMFT